MRLGFLGRNFGGFSLFTVFHLGKTCLSDWSCIASHGVRLKPSKALTLNLQLALRFSTTWQPLALHAHFNGFPVFSQGIPITQIHFLLQKRCIQLHTFALYLLYCLKFSEIVTGIYQLARTLFSMIINRF